VVIGVACTVADKYSSLRRDGHAIPGAVLEGVMRADARAFISA
jgi:hypothetical protein